MSYGREMTWIACFVASHNLNCYGKETVRELIEGASCETVIDFFERYQIIFGVDMKEQLDYCIEIEKEMFE